MKKISIIVSILIMAFLFTSKAHSFTFTMFDYPSISSGGYTIPTGINNSGQVVGRYGDGRSVQGSFVYDGSTFTEIVLPGNAYGSVDGISNNGSIVGGFLNSSRRYGFIKRGSSYTTFAHPSASVDIYAYGVNDSGHVVGQYYDNNTGLFTSYFYDGNTFTDMVIPGAINEPASPWAPPYGVSGISNNGSIIGTVNQNTNTHGFIYHGSSYTIFDHPTARAATLVARGINNFGQVVGTYVKANGISRSRSFFYDGNTFTDIIIPGITVTNISVSGISNNGSIVGTVWDGIRHRGFIGVQRVPEPSTLLLLGSGLAGLGFVRRKFKT